MAEAIEIYNEHMRTLIPPEAFVEKVANGAVWSEGPVYFHEDDSVIWSDAHGNRLLRWSAKDGVTVVRDPSDYQSGNYRDLEGRLVSCSCGLRAIIRREHDNRWQILVDRYQGKRFNSPNDLVVKSDGTIWFTDPPYGLTQPNQGYGGQQAEILQVLKQQNKKLSQLVADLLLLAKLDRQQTKIFHPCCLNDLVDDLIEELAFLAVEAKVKLVKQLHLQEKKLRFWK